MSNMSGKNMMKKVENNIQRGIRNATMRQSPGKANKPNRKYASWTGSTHKGPNAVLVPIPPAMANGSNAPYVAPKPSAPPMSMENYMRHLNTLKTKNYKGTMGKLNGGKSRKHRKSRKASRRRLTRRRR